MENIHKERLRRFMGPEFEKQHKRGRVWGGIILVFVGAAFLARTLHVMLPHWLFTWPVILILAGIYTLGKHGFQRPGGLIPIVIGAVFLMDEITPGIKVAHILWPALVILLGLIIIFSPWRKWRHRHHHWSENPMVSVESSDEDYILVDSVFGGVEKTVVSKNFKGGKINCVFGGAEINLLQADIQGPVTLEISTVFGGTDLTVPSGWKVQTEISATLGGVQDQRPMNDEALDTNKVLILKGSVIFGGVSIKAY